MIRCHSQVLNHATSSSAWQGIISAMTDKQVAALSNEIVQEIRRR